MPDLDEEQEGWLKNGIGSGDAAAGEQVVIVAYAPPSEGSDGGLPEEVVFMRRGVADHPKPKGNLRFSKYFYPRPPWEREYNGDKSALYAGVSYAKQIAAMGSAEFLKFHLAASIQGVMDAIVECGNMAGGPHSSVAEEFVPELGKLRDEVEESIQGVGSRGEVSRIFNSLSSKMDGIMDRVLQRIGQQSGLPGYGVSGSSIRRRVSGGDSDRYEAAA